MGQVDNWSHSDFPLYAPQDVLVTSTCLHVVTCWPQSPQECCDHRQWRWTQYGSNAFCWDLLHFVEMKVRPPWPGQPMGGSRWGPSYQPSDLIQNHLLAFCPVCFHWDYLRNSWSYGEGGHNRPHSNRCRRACVHRAGVSGGGNQRKQRTLENQRAILER
jgi:hypothetical protein